MKKLFIGLPLAILSFIAWCGLEHIRPWPTHVKIPTSSLYAQVPAFRWVRPWGNGLEMDSLFSKRAVIAVEVNGRVAYIEIQASPTKDSPLPKPTSSEKSVSTIVLQ